MNNFLNLIIAGGYLSDDVKSTYDENRKTTVAKFYLKNPGQIGNNKYGNDLYVITYGKLAEECVLFLSKGKACTVKGKFSTWNKPDKNGGEQHGITVLASDVIFNQIEENVAFPSVLEENRDYKSDDTFFEDADCE